jgi:hypothetical protein
MTSRAAKVGEDFRFLLLLSVSVIAALPRLLRLFNDLSDILIVP